ncbi:MAG: nicotinate-nucleotide adenylyltransferase [Acetobacteraceae bacterium]
MAHTCIEGPHDPIPRFGDRRRMRIGLLGGSFNPAHAGHLHVARLALQRLRLDQVWLMVSPGNVLKPRDGMALFSERLKSAAGLADGRRIVATGIEAALDTRYSADTLRALSRRFPRASFVWIMGADILEQLPHWSRWREIARAIPFAIVPRGGHNARILAGHAARALRSGRRRDREAATLPGATRPAWAFLTVPSHPASATAIREGIPS